MAIRGAHAWVDYLDKVELPVLSKTIQSIAFISESDDLHIEELVAVILRDADLTSKVMKLANSSCYNPLRLPTSTMSRAIVQVGFDSIKAIAISSVLVDQLTRKNNKQQLFDCLVRSFHAAVQAKYLAADLPAEERESIFIAALLFDVGEAAFWSSCAKQTDELGQLLSQSQHSYLDDQKDVLGTSFKSISRGLSKCWRLGELLEESLSKPSSRAAHIVCAAVELAHCHDHGWDKAAMAKMLPALSGLTDRSGVEISKDLYLNADSAAMLAEQFGIKGARSYLKRKRANVAMQAKPEQQFEALLKISESMASEHQSFDHLVSFILESIHRTVGLERVGLFLAKPESSNFSLWKFEGRQVLEWQKRKDLYVGDGHPILSALKSRDTQLILSQYMGEKSNQPWVVNAPFERAIPALIGPVCRGKSCLAFVYADRLNQSEISRQQVASFRLFSQQVQLCFDNKRKGL